MKVFISLKFAGQISMAVICTFAMLTSQLVAQTEISNEDYLYTYYADESYQELVIPTSTEATYLYLEANGGDGGRSKGHHGGQGAMTRAFFHIDTGSAQVPPGSTLRLVPGKQGRSASDYTGMGSGAGGGGGSAVVLLPNGEVDWNTKSIILMVAGGGGGAGLKCNGGPGYVGEHGAAGTTSGCSPLDNASDVLMHGESTDDASGGAAMHQNASPPTEISICNQDDRYGAKKGWPEGGVGCPCVLHGGFGFGGGGSGNSAGGGGGGYSGGSAGECDLHGCGGGGGGGSYMTGKLELEQKSILDMGTTSSPHDGYIRYGLLTSTSLNIRLAAVPQKCMEIENAELHDGNNMQLWECAPLATTQSWKMDGYTLKPFFDESKCANVDGASTSNGTNIRIRNCNNTDAQNWIYDGVSRQLRSLLDLDKCLNVARGGLTYNGMNIQLWDCNVDGGEDQWIMSGAETVSDPTEFKYIVPIKDSGLALQSASGAHWGSNVQLGTRNSNDSSERWAFDDLQIKYSPSRDLCVTLKDANTDNGTNIELRGCSNVDAKKWIYDGMTKQIRSAVDPAKCLEVADGVFKAGTNIQIRNCNIHSRQKFDIKS